MSDLSIAESNERSLLIDAGNKFIIPQYINFFLFVLEHVLKQYLKEARLTKSLMIPFNKGYEQIIVYIKAGKYSRRHVNTIVEIFNEGYAIIFEYAKCLTYEEQQQFEELVHVIVSKICHLVRYEQRYSVRHKNTPSMLSECSWDNLFHNTRLDIDEITCKSKENPAFTHGKLYVVVCEVILKLINDSLLALYDEGIDNEVNYLLDQTDICCKGIERLNYLEQYISEKVVISRAYIRYEMYGVRHYFKRLKNAYIKVLREDSIQLVHVERVKELKRIAVHIKSLEWGLYFLTMIYGSTYIDGRGQFKIYNKYYS